MNGYIIYESIISSRRWNRLLQHPDGELSQLIYLLSYIKADFWGHLPFDCEWIKLQILPGSNRTHDEIRVAMALLLATRLWDPPYRIEENLYVHIFGFEKWSRGGIRKRMRGQWPDERGVLPHRDLKTSIDDDFASAQTVRSTATTYINILTFPEFSGIFRNLLEKYPQFELFSRNFQSNTTSTVQYSTVQYKNTEAANAGFLDSFPQVIHISGKEIRKSYLVRLFKKLNGDIHQLCLVLFRANTANNPYAYIERGITDGYIYEPSTAEYESPSYVQAWIDQLCGISTSTPRASKNRDTDPESISNLISNLIPQEDKRHG